MSDSETLHWTISDEQAGQRLDVFLTGQLPEYSRTFLRKLIASDAVQVDGESAKVAYRVNAGQRVTLQPIDLPRTGPEPEDIPLDILFEDEHIAAINKPPGMVVHPAKGHWRGTLTSALAFHFAQLSTVGGPTRPGIVHRLDRDTSGVIVVAKTDSAHAKLAEQFAARTIEKEYVAIVSGSPDRDRDVIDMPIGPHPHQREKMAIRTEFPDARAATTFYEVAERFARHAIIRVMPKTGRTHQIRLHLAHIGHPVLCDRLYAGHSQITFADLGAESTETGVVLDRQALHAQRLALTHPKSGEAIELTAPLAEDIQSVTNTLRQMKKRV